MECGGIRCKGFEDAKIYGYAEGQAPLHSTWNFHVKCGREEYKVK
jgi:hypothetical protein